jgi:hypothetical protein
MLRLNNNKKYVKTKQITLIGDLIRFLKSFKRVSMALSPIKSIPLHETQSSYMI